ncbi:putative Leucine-rich receptor-like kinase family protein [Quillaja saponaria]|uniref:Leucine-rich receptor-like kinase family protein n=1 Tax=Quillaja saponaria TaxID=32244 RepID=A0AAD7L1B7_QUISA|nr:putative Leucine-rich receptor-like kinase family protein [Quillaja saponaria]
MTIPFVNFMLLLLFSNAITPLNFTLCKGEYSKVTCSVKEKQALLKFKKGLTDPINWLSSWSESNQQDCCSWIGIRCNNNTGQVTEISLGNTFQDYSVKDDDYHDHTLGGEISSSLLELEFLTCLNLSLNNFNSIQIPSFLGSLRSLTHLDLRGAGFSGLIPHQLGNLSNLLYVNLGYNSGLQADNLHWMSNLLCLEYLELTDVYVHNYEVLSVLPSTITEIHLSGCGLERIMIPYQGYATTNFTSLRVLDLSKNLLNDELKRALSNFSTSLELLNLGFNSLQGEIPHTILNFKNLKELILDDNEFIGQIPEFLGRLKNLEYLSLSDNSLTGPIPSILGNLSFLRVLDLGGNKLNGTIPKSLGILSNLFLLRLGHNSLEGPVEEAHFSKLSKLDYLDMPFTNLFLNVSSSWVPPFQLTFLSSFKMGPKFPVWLQNQKSLKLLWISNSGIADIAPSWFWNWMLQVRSVDISGNQISGDISDILLNSSFINLSSNCLKGKLPQLTSRVNVLKVSNNLISGRISPFLCERMNRANKLAVLDVSNNLLSGVLGNCWLHWETLTHLNLGANNLSGRIPPSIGNLSGLVSLRLHNNSISGYLPSTLQNCSQLGFLDIGQNKFSQTIPLWIWDMTGLVILRLKSNYFMGKLHKKICELSNLIVLDLSNNNLSGSIPSCLNKIKAMVVVHTQSEESFSALEYGDDYEYYMENLKLAPKGNELEYEKNLKFVRIIDLSSNRLSGLIPSEITTLTGVRFLNLSRNNLLGQIPKDIGEMKLLESLDLSMNYISGEISQSLSSLSFLSHLNLSYNSLSGRIPKSTQLQSFNAYSYIGNAELCGDPLTKICTRHEESDSDSSSRQAEDDSGTSEFYIGMGVGFAVSFWGVCSVLFFNRTWRHAYFQFLENMTNYIYVTVVLKVKWFNGKLRSRPLGTN